MYLDPENARMELKVRNITFEDGHGIDNSIHSVL